MIATLLAVLLAILLSFQGAFFILLGIVAFLCLPLVPRITGVGKPLRDLHLWLALWAVGRAAFVVTKHDEILFKQMSFKDTGVEEISFANTVKEFLDPARRMHYWMGTPFALADEVHGVIFDPRDAAVGERKRQARENGEMVVKATGTERDMYEVFGWIRGVFEFPKHTYELVSLSSVRHLVTGSERAEHPERVNEFYAISREPYWSDVAATKLVMIIAALIGPFGAMWFFASQGTGTGGGTTIGYGIIPLLVALPRFDVPWKAVAVGGLPVVLFVLLAVVTSPVYAIIALVLVVAGLLFMPAVTFVARAIAPVAGALARYVYLKLGLLGYQKPVMVWTPQKYELREYDDLESTSDVHWYGVAGSLLGFTFPPDADSWDQRVYEDDDIDPRLVSTDGGGKTNLPAGFSRFPDIRRARYGAFVPSKHRLDDETYYVDSGIALSRFAGAAEGDRSLRALEEAKEEHGSSDGMSDRMAVYATVACGIVSFASGVVVFFL